MPGGGGVPGGIDPRVRGAVNMKIRRDLRRLKKYDAM